MRWARWPAAAGLCALLLAGCAPLGSAVTDRSAGTGAVQSFTLGGRLSIRQGDHNDVVRIEWQHTPRREQIALSTPLGGQVMQLDATPQQASLQLPNRPPLQAPDAQALMQDVLGYALPVHGLAAWVSGEVDAAAVVAQEGSGPDRVVHFAVDGWQGSLQRWRSVGGSELPGLVAVQRDALALRLVVDQWTVQRGDP